MYSPKVYSEYYTLNSNSNCKFLDSQFFTKFIGYTSDLKSTSIPNSSIPCTFSIIIRGSYVFVIISIISKNRHDVNEIKIRNADNSTIYDDTNVYDNYTHGKLTSKITTQSCTFEIYFDINSSTSMTVVLECYYF